MLEKVVADLTIQVEKKQETTIGVHVQYHISVTPVPPKRYSSTSKDTLQYQLGGTESGTETIDDITSKHINLIITSENMNDKE